MAAELPQATFVGIERAGMQARTGQATIKELGLKNITLLHRDMLDVDAQLGQFDYIIAHGVFSWVPGEVQDKTLSICKQNLDPNGIAYVSYNTYPGWHMRGMVRDMMLFHTSQFTDPQAKVQQARALVEFLADSVPTKNNPYGLWLTQELKNMQGWKDNYMLHESLEEVNEPVYFWQFMERATDHELQYLGDAEFSTMVTGNFDDKVRETLHRIGRNIVAMEQYMDFIRNRMFRRTLLCHQDVSLRRNLSPRIVEQFHIRSAAKPRSPTPRIKGSAPETFVTAKGITLTSSTPIVKAALCALAEQYPRAVAFNELSRQACATVSADEADEPTADQLTKHRSLLADSMLLAFASDKIELLRFADRFGVEVNSHPRTSALVRRQAVAGTRVTNLRHEPMTLDAASRVLVQHLDGRHNHAALVGILVKQTVAGQLAVEEEGEAVTDKERLQSHFAARLDGFLARCAECALLCK
jgi:methyltransferase-like protein